MASQPGVGWGANYFGWGPVFSQSVAVVFDTYANSGDPSIPYMGVSLDGTPSSLTTYTGSMRTFSNGSTWSCWLDYNGATQSLEVRLASSSTRPALTTLQTTLNLYTIIGQSIMYLGFGAGSSGSYSIPVISAFSYAVTSIPESIPSFSNLFIFFFVSLLTESPLFLLSCFFFFFD